MAVSTRSPKRSVPVAAPQTARAPRRHLPPVEVLVLTGLALMTRLAGITYPRAIVFDEVYFREYALRYQSGSYYFDLHPPLGKLLLGAWAVLIGEHGSPTSTDPAVGLRVLPALAGTALVVVVYQLLRELSASRKVATFAAALVLMDNALLVESRLTLVDSMLLLFGVSALTCFLAARRMVGRAHWLMLTAAGVLAGMTVATKWTGLAILGVIGLLWLVGALREPDAWWRKIARGAVIAVSAGLVYVVVFAVHFALLPNAGPGDAYMSQKFQSVLRGNANFDPNAGMSFPQRFLELNQAMPSYEHSLDTSTHPYSSTWLSWPFMQRPVYYFNAPGTDQSSEHYIYLLGNPVIWWGLLLAVVVITLAWVRRPDRFAPRIGAIATLGVAYLADYLPFATITRPMFLYHYFFALIFCIGAVSVGLGQLAGWDTDGEEPWRFPSRASLVVYVSLLAVALAGFVYFAPLSYGTELSDGGLAARDWLASWR